jgi:hypothetical protein
MSATADYHALFDNLKSILSAAESFCDDRSKSNSESLRDVITEGRKVIDRLTHYDAEGLKFWRELEAAATKLPPNEEFEIGKRYLIDGVYFMATEWSDYGGVIHNGYSTVDQNGANTGVTVRSWVKKLNPEQLPPGYRIDPHSDAEDRLIEAYRKERESCKSP